MSNFNDLIFHLRNCFVYDESRFTGISCMFLVLVNKVLAKIAEKFTPMLESESTKKGRNPI